MQSIPESLQASQSPHVDTWGCYLNTQQAEWRICVCIMCILYLYFVTLSANHGLCSVAPIVVKVMGCRDMYCMEECLGLH